MLHSIWIVFLTHTEQECTHKHSLFLFNQSSCLCKHSVYLSHTALFRDKKNTANTSIHSPPARAFYGASVFHSFTRHKELAGCRAAPANLFQPVSRYAICIGLHCIGAHNSLARHLLVFSQDLMCIYHNKHIRETKQLYARAVTHFTTKFTQLGDFFPFLSYQCFLR